MFALAAAALTSVIFGLAPALRMATGRQEGALLSTLQAGGVRTTPRRRFARRGLVAVQIALSVVLLIASLLFLRSLFAIRGTDPGFDPQRLSTFQTFLPETDYPEATGQLAFLERLRAGIGAIPGVESVTYMSGLPPRRRLNANDTALEGVPEGEGHPAHNMDYWQFAGPGYFETMGIPLLAGRGFTASDDGGATPVAVVNETAARLFWPGQDPVGRRLRPPGNPETPWFTIVGVAGDVKQGGLEAETGTEVYFHYPQTAAAVGFAPRTVNLVIRSGLPGAGLAGPVREATHALDPAIPVDGYRTMDAVLADSVEGPRFLALLLAVFAGLAVVLAATGAGSVVSALAVERTSEMGVRMAFGAGRPDLVRLVFAQGLRLVGIGLGIGLIAVLRERTCVIESLLFGVAPADPASYAAAVVIVLVCRRRGVPGPGAPDRAPAPRRGAPPKHEAVVSAALWAAMPVRDRRSAAARASDAEQRCGVHTGLVPDEAANRDVRFRGHIAGTQNDDGESRSTARSVVVAPFAL